MKNDRKKCFIIVLTFVSMMCLLLFIKPLINNKDSAKVDNDLQKSMSYLRNYWNEYINKYGGAENFYENFLDSKSNYLSRNLFFINELSELKFAKENETLEKLAKSTLTNASKYGYDVFLSHDEEMNGKKGIVTLVFSIENNPNLYLIQKENMDSFTKLIFYSSDQYSSLNEIGIFDKFEINNGISLLIAFAVCALLFVYATSAGDNDTNSRIDKLTGLYNELIIEEKVLEWVEKDLDELLTFVSMDIVDFYRFNNIFGHNTGDILLKRVASIINSNTLCAFRINKDLFAFIIDSKTRIEDLDNQIKKAIRKEIGYQASQMTYIKYGLFNIVEKEISYRKIYDCSVLALKLAKRQKKSIKCVYCDEYKEYISRKNYIEINMISALKSKDFKLFIQPKCDLQSNECSGGEALVRWDSPKHGILNPDKFIPVFEDNGFIIEIDFYMLNEVFKMLENQLHAGGKLLPISVNQSKLTVTSPNYLNRLQNLVKSYRVPCSYVELEITESALESDFETISHIMHTIDAMGFKVSMDDFGSGYSSLNALKSLPVKVLKIDKGFFHEASDSEKSGIILRSIVNMSKKLDIEVICEGAETKKQYDFLKNVGCDYLQGYIYEKPMPSSEYEERFIVPNDSKDYLLGIYG